MWSVAVDVVLIAVLSFFIVLDYRAYRRISSFVVVATILLLLNGLVLYYDVMKLLQ